MKWLLVSGLVIGSLAHLVRADDKKFSQSMTPEDFAAAGLNQLTPAQVSRLDALATAFKNGAVASIRQSADEALAAKRAAEAETKAAKAEVLEFKKTSLGFFSKAKIILMPGTKIEYAVVKSTIPGKFQGWEGHANFHLANGQDWQVANADNYYTPTRENIEVEITQSALGGYWMRFPDLDTEVRVRLLADK